MLSFLFLLIILFVHNWRVVLHLHVKIFELLPLATQLFGRGNSSIRLISVGIVHNNYAIVYNGHFFIENYYVCIKSLWENTQSQKRVRQIEYCERAGRSD